jgi:argininosuccinate lyase
MKSINSKNSIGGTAPSQVKKQISAAKGSLNI